MQCTLKKRWYICNGCIRWHIIRMHVTPPAQILQLHGIYINRSLQEVVFLCGRFFSYDVQPCIQYFWEQEEFDIISRQTRISLHFQAGKKQMLRHAFTYHWRLWSIPEIKDCLEEAGFKSIHVWIKEMPNTQSSRNAKEYNADRAVKYEESQRFNQGDAWNAYIVGVANILA